ncbi:hypothetical protein F5Y16DRAFT_382533 [Xylariaceae sp. FL0255]|nr:hypothetical protein F5Y16DRAFT_382533 [Xylariaceae sp. FL0255]
MPDVNSIPEMGEEASPPPSNAHPNQSSQQHQQNPDPSSATSPDSALTPLQRLREDPPETPMSITSHPIDNTGVGAGPGPLRHPRPLTAAELHSQMEAEQELMVNRLTRDLNSLRAAQNSSVVSNASSTSAAASASEHPSSFTDTHMLSGPGFPVPTTRRHHRTSSSASTRSFGQAGLPGSTSAPIPIPQSHSGNAASVLEAARNPRGATSMSRQNSMTSHRSSSRARSPHPYLNPYSSSFSQSHGLHDHGPSGFTLRDAASSNASVAATPGSSELSPGLLPATLRYEETAHYRQELEMAKNENEALKRRVRELEKMLRERRESTSSFGRTRSESNSTTTSVSLTGTTGVGGVVGGGTGIAGDRREERRGVERATSTMSVASSVAVGVPLDEVKVGESASSAGLRPDTKA